MSTDDFGARPFVAGSLVGLRSFGVQGNELVGVIRRIPWAPGENEAVCAPTIPGLAAMLRPDLFANDHPKASVHCTCGFYAYYGSANEYGNRHGYHGYHGYHGPTITGIIEGYGVATVGSRGFRAAKARIRALVRASGCGCCAPPDFTQVFDQYPDVPVYDTTELALAAHPTTKPEDVGFEPAHDDPWEVKGVVASNWYNFAPGNYTVSNMQGQVIYSYSSGIQHYLPAETEPEPKRKPRKAVPEPVRLKQEAAELAAQRREQSRLGNLGGIERRAK